MSTRDYSAVARQYCEDVVSGKILACKWIKLACQKHLDDLADPDSRFVFDEKQVSRYCSFIELLKHVKGPSAGQHFHLEPFQVWIVASIVGWLRKETRLRRYREALLLLPRKSGKSFLSSALAVAFFCLDPDPGKETYSAANSEKQAWYVFGVARQMVLDNPQLQKTFGIEVNAKSLVRHGDGGSKFAPIIGRAQDGGSPSLAILDEYHEADASDLFDSLKSGQGARKEPLMLVISTAGVNLQSPCYAYQLDCQKMLEGTIEREDCFAAIYGIDEADQWAEFDSIVKASPNLGVSNDIEFLKSELANALRDPRAQARFRTKYLNQWLNSSSSWSNMQRWNELADPSLKEDDFIGDPGVMACDLSSKLDIAASVRVYRRHIKGQDHYYVFGNYYLPEERATDPTLQHYNIWLKQGHLTGTPGNVIDYDMILEDAVDRITKNRIQEFGFDPWNAAQFAQSIAKQTPAQVVEIPQQVRFLSEPMKNLEALIVDSRVHHNGHPVLAWCMSNVVCQIDRNGNVFPRKERNESKIDGAVALIMAISRICLKNTASKSGYFEPFFV